MKIRIFPSRQHELLTFVKIKQGTTKNTCSFGELTGVLGNIARVKFLIAEIMIL